MSEISKIGIVEALIFASPGPISPDKICSILSMVEPDDVDRMVDKLNRQYENNGHAFRIKRIAGGYQFFTLTSFAPFVGELFVDREPIRLTRATLEVLAIIALKQPVTRPVIGKIRGADSSTAVHNLLEQGLITIKGRQKSPGRPFLYATTGQFLKLFGLETLGDLPKEEELAEMFREFEEPTEPPEDVPEERENDEKVEGSIPEEVEDPDESEG